MKSITPAVTDRVRGKRPSRSRSFLAAATVGIASAVLTYRLLRRPADDEHEED